MSVCAEEFYSLRELESTLKSGSRGFSLPTWIKICLSLHMSSECKQFCTEWIHQITSGCIRIWSLCGLLTSSVKGRVKMKPCILEKQTQLRGLAVGHTKGRKKETAQGGSGHSGGTDPSPLLCPHANGHRGGTLLWLRFLQVLFYTLKNFFLFFKIFWPYLDTQSYPSWDQTCAPHSGSTETQPLDHQEVEVVTLHS